MVAIFLLWAITSICSGAGVNLLANPGFEEAGSWNCGGFTCELTTDKYEGEYAWNVTGRTKVYQGPGQFVNVTQRTRYEVSAYVKLSDDAPGELFQEVKITMKYIRSGSTPTYVKVAHQPTVWANNWVYLYGNFMTPSYAFTSARLYFSGPKLSTGFILDSSSLEEIPENTNWQSESDAVIDAYRKQDMDVHVVSNGSFNPSEVQIEVMQTKHAFPFGTAVKQKDLTNASLQMYRDYIYDHFNWAVLANDLKWRQTEWRQGNIDYETPKAAITELKNHGLKVRGHTIVWSVKDNNPVWVQSLTGQALKDVTNTRVRGVVNATKGMLEHWDVNNENLHGWFFQEQTNDFDYYLDIYKEAHLTDPDVKLFSNDYNVVSAGALTQVGRVGT